ncbi:MAG: Antitoxin MazE [Chroococcidiopsis sp. SAG 2025]|uniref:AbrB/MazE/SpoVT family DNA-binding domain-containing protein n=1 Tax=Chroococcidiopsis sp. SAG 2025 TaxID=171389 RepID=UPI00293723E7|nr:AbrB/MazE/SpoVT family DNA-binding domain-containing protein [Chroococcidiopsis sp. SAG 2025]MDV2996858.1 Antitoxin MazE [Chroococcidiopsis sp. SAG 2025]
MSQTITRWGNSLGLRIPKEIAEQAQLTEGAIACLEVVDGALVVRAVKPRRNRYKLSELLEGITPENLHSETDTGEPVGNEVW